MRRTRLIGALACVAALGGATTAQADTTVTVTDTTPSWTAGDTRPSGSGVFQVQAGAPLGAGSFRMTTPDATAKVQRMTSDYVGTPLSAFQEISYSTFRYPGSAGVATPAINLVLDHTGDGLADTYMVYEPYQDQGNAAVQDNVWQDWDTIRGGAGEWWLSHPGTSGCGQATPCAFSVIASTYPSAAIAQPTGGVIRAGSAPGSLGVNQGSGNAGVDGATDALAITIGGETTTYDFEPTLSPASKDDCKNGGWQQFNSPAFKNQGDCVSSFAPGKNK